MRSHLPQVHTGEIPQIEGFLRFVCLSDTHDKASSLTVPNGDILLHSGDFSRAGQERDVIRFNKFLSSQPHRHKVVIAGNHDLSFDLANQESLQKNCPSLENLQPSSNSTHLLNFPVPWMGALPQTPTPLLIVRLAVSPPMAAACMTGCCAPHATMLVWRSTRLSSKRREVKPSYLPHHLHTYQESQDGLWTFKEQKCHWDREEVSTQCF